jgi:cytochrome c2
VEEGEERCNKCHADGAPLYFVDSPVELRRRLVGQRIPEKARLSEEEYERIAAFVTGMRSHEDKWIFRSRCARCHLLSHLAWEDRHPDDWRMIVERIARYSPTYYNQAAVAQVVSHLAEEYSSGDSGPGVAGDAYRGVRLAVRTCTGCHFISRNAEANAGMSREAALVLVRRMNDKLYEPLDDAQVVRIADAYRAIVADPATMKRLVPHDRPMLVAPAPAPREGKR